MGIGVETLDGQVTYSEGRSYTITGAGELIVLDADGAEVARFVVGNWLNAVRLP